MTPQPLRRLADDVAIVVRGADAVVLRGDVEVLRVPGAGPAAHRLGLWWRRPRRRDEPAATAVRDLAAVLEAHGVLVEDSLTRHLLDLHAATVGGRAVPEEAADDTAFLVRDAGGPYIRLPAAVLGPTTLAAALRDRRTARGFRGAPLPLAELATLLGAAAGTSGGAGPDRLGALGPARSHPSGGACYPVETHVAAVDVTALEPAGYRYHPLAHALSRRAAASSPAALPRMFPDLSEAGPPAAVVVFTVDVARPSLHRYGGKAYRLALLEAGHIAQSLLLAAAALAVAGLPLCGFDEEAVARSVGLDEPGELAVYAVALGPV